MDDPTVRDDDDATALENIEACPACGYKGTPLRADEGDLQEFVRSILGNRAFVKEYLLYDSNVAISFKTLTANESSHLSQLLLQISSEVEDNAYQQEYAIKLKLLYYLQRFADKIMLPVILTGWKDTLKNYDLIFGEYSDNVISVCVKTLVHFLWLQRALIEEAQDSNFWIGAGLH